MRLTGFPLWLGAFLIAIVMFGLNGVLGACLRLSRAWNRRKPAAKS